MAQSSVMAPTNRPSTAVPSSFDSDPDFFEESRSAKLWRRIREEPLVPLGTLATCYALYRASVSIRKGDHHQTNRMFRMRIYAQGFTLVAIVGGSMFWKDDRLKRKEFEKVITEKKAAEKKEKWLKELEARDQEDKEWRSKFEGVAQRARQAEETAKKNTGLRALLVQQGQQGTGDEAKKEAKTTKQADAGGGIPKAIRTTENNKDTRNEKDQTFPVKSVIEQVKRTTRWGHMPWRSIER